MPVVKAKQHFIRNQGLARLVGDDAQAIKVFVCHLSEESDRQPDKKPKAKWVSGDRDVFFNDAFGEKPWKRVGLVCEAGLGKSTSMDYLQYFLSQHRSPVYLPMLIKLEDKLQQKLLIEASSNPDKLLDELVARVLRGTEQDPKKIERCLREHRAQGGIPLKIERCLREHRAKGGIPLLIDGLDHALTTEGIAEAIRDVITSKHWQNCPVWITGRPYAFQRCWDTVFDESWEYLEVERFTANNISDYMRRTIGTNYAKYFPEASRRLLEVPRILRLICEILKRAQKQSPKLSPKELVEQQQLRTAADVYARAYFDPGDETSKDENKEPRLDTRGLIGQGLVSESRAFGLNREAKSTNYQERIQRCGAFIGAIAFAMHSLPGKVEPLEPATAGVPLCDVQDKVVSLLEEAKQGDISYFERNYELLKQMNTHHVDFLLVDNTGELLKFPDRTTQAFFAAYWVANFATKTDRQKMLAWITNAKDERLKGFWEFWQFVAEMPDKCKPGSIAMVERETWKEVLLPCYAHPHQLNEGKFKRRWVEWHREMLILSFPSMKKRFPNVIVDWRKKDEHNPIWVEFLAGFKPVPPGDCYFGSESERSDVKPVPVSGFKLHQYPVTNKVYELFDPSHKAIRWEKGTPHPLRNDADCPVVNVSWFDASCFALWCGDRFSLPTELQWEHAARAGSKAMYWWGDSDAEIDQHAWHDGNSKGSTHPVGEQGHANEWGLSDMLGQVWEWCSDNYDNYQKNVRGGSWYYNSRNCRVSYRFRFEPVYRYHDFGFRLASCLDFL